MEAVADWKADQRIQGFKQEMQQQSYAQQQERRNQEIARQAQSRLSKAAEKYHDFDEVALGDHVTITKSMAEAIAESDVGGEIAYYLGSNPDEAAKIAQLSTDTAVGRAIAKLEAKLSTTPVATKAPPPIVPGGTKAPLKSDTFNLPWDEFKAKRRKELGHS